MQALIPDEVLPAVKAKCRAHRRDGSPCSNPPMLGGYVCRMHGGSAPQVRAKAAERIAMARDLAVEVLIEQIDQFGHLMDPKVLTDLAVKFTDKVELLEGRVTDRKESKTTRDPEQVRAALESRIDELRQRREQREAANQ